MMFNLELEDAQSMNESLVASQSIQHDDLFAMSWYALEDLLGQQQVRYTS
jgi:hypothetical protein